MPSLSKAQQRLMGAAEHGADFPLAVKLRETMTHTQLHDFASGSMAKKPEHVKPASAPTPKVSPKAAAPKASSGTHPHRNLGHYLHAKKSR